MDGFGDSFVPPAEGTTLTTEVDPAAEFLAREQDQLAGLGDDIIPATLGNDQPTLVAGLDGEADLFGGAPVNGGPDLESFEMLGGDEVPQESAPAAPTSEPDLARSPIPYVPREDPEKIKIWREAQRIRLEQKDAAEEVSKIELKEKAKKELEDWYKQHEEQVAKTRQANREASKSAEKELVADTAKMEPGTEWERITKLCNFNPKTSKSSRDISRMRSIILQVKQNPPIKA
ncbi:clathrin light chain isoform X6 [Procambarus clarkii]|uniref:clathrin light chain isoform X6 n=1 Tax=Procambarus clarkii TaxID=6728 RepID=UPI001E66FF2B|nr:clathrin light chain-like isoform X6 [Procambarus clarkii]